MVAGNPRQPPRVTDSPFEQKKYALDRHRAAIDHIAQKQDAAIGIEGLCLAQQGVQREEVAMQITNEEPVLHCAHLVRREPSHLVLLAKVQQRKRRPRVGREQAPLQVGEQVGQRQSKAPQLLVSVLQQKRGAGIDHHTSRTIKGSFSMPLDELPTAMRMPSRSTVVAVSFLPSTKVSLGVPGRGLTAQAAPSIR